MVLFVVVLLLFVVTTTVALAAHALVLAFAAESKSFAHNRFIYKLNFFHVLKHILHKGFESVSCTEASLMVCL